MTRKGGEATCEALALHDSSPRFLQRHAVVMGRGMPPAPNLRPERFVFLGKWNAQASGIVTRKGGNRQGSVSEASRARKDAHTISILKAIEAFASDSTISKDERIHELMHIAFTADYWRCWL